jgi:glycosyltransferase involved in cell wall biosynthesis
MNRKALLLVTTSYPGRADGSEAAGAFVADLAEQLSDTIPVRVVAPGAVNGARESVNGIDVWRFATPGRPLSLLSPARPIDWPPIFATLRALRQQTLAAVSDGNVAHTLALWVLPSGWAAQAAKRKHGIPYSVWALGSDIWTLGRLPGTRQVLRNVIGGAAHCFADGLQLGDDAARIGGRPFDFLPSTRRLGRNRIRPLASTPPYRFLFLGRWHPNKGIDLLLDALALLDDEAWSRIADVHVAGGGPMQNLVQARVAELQGAGRPIRLSGYLDRNAAGEALDQADWLLLPSRIESIPVVFSDAMQMGLPVISTPVGDLPALMSRQAPGVLAPAVDARSFAGAIRAALELSPSRFAQATANASAEFALAPEVLLKLIVPAGADINT